MTTVIGVPGPGKPANPFTAESRQADAPHGAIGRRGTDRIRLIPASSYRARHAIMPADEGPELCRRISR